MERKIAEQSSLVVSEGNVDDFHSGELLPEPKPPLQEHEIGSAGVGHVNYPHPPGYLYDCPGCEAECFCDTDRLTPECVHCDIERSRWLDYQDYEDEFHGR